MSENMSNHVAHTHADLDELTDGRVIEEDPNAVVYGIRPHRPMTQEEHDLAKLVAEQTSISQQVLASLRIQDDALAVRIGKTALETWVTGILGDGYSNFDEVHRHVGVAVLNLLLEEGLRR